ncbi:MAG TPA: ribosome maturation factor RimM [Gaiellaceae bacterium]|nr:ribosome maturation factor RimM [Gaiellaceae bacterium]
MPDWVAIGRVGRPHGLDGSFVVEQASDAAERFAPGARVYVGREPAGVVGAKRAGNRLVVRLDRTPARGALLELPAAELPAAGEGSFYVFELVGLAVEEEGGRRLGLVQDVAPGVANDVLELDTGLALPMVEDCVLDVDLHRRRIVVAPGFAEPS